MDFKKEVNKLVDCFENIEKYEIDLSDPIMPSLDFSKSRQNLYLQSLQAIVRNIQNMVRNLEVEEDDEEYLIQLKSLIIKLDTTDNNEFKEILHMLLNLANKLHLKEEKKIELPVSIPNDIFQEIEADVNEISKCFNSGCFRSVVILCGRVIEVALHRKYFEATQNDLLEKSPGIGLGNLIAKMKDQKIEFDPGITQQIHLINQVRIFSVHKKQQPFYPSKGQTQAMVLYTMDVLEKLFN